MASFSDISVLNDDEQISLHNRALCGINGRAVHAPYLGLYAGSPDEAVRKATFDCFQKAYRTAEELNAGHIVFHHNYDSLQADGS